MTNTPSSTPADSVRNFLEKLGGSAGPNNGDPILWLTKKFTSVPDDFEETMTTAKEETETKQFALRHFWEDFINRIINNENNEEAMEQMEQMNQLNLAVVLSELHASHNNDQQAIDQFYLEKGVGNINLIENSELITDRGTKEKPTATQLERLIMEVMSELPNFRKIIEYIKNNDVSLKEIVQEAFKINNCYKAKKRRDELRVRLFEIMKKFDDLLNANPKLKEALLTIQREMLEQKKILIQSEGHAKRETEGVQEHFKSRANHAKQALEKLYQLKTLNGQQALRLLDTSEGINKEARTAFLNAFNINANQLFETFYTNEIEDKLTLENLPDDIDQKKLPSRDDAKKWCLFLANNPLGKKIAQRLKIDFGFFAKELSKTINVLIHHICPHVEAAKAGSFDELTQKIAEDPSIDHAGYAAIAILSNSRYAAIEVTNEELWKTLSNATKTPPKQRGDTLKNVQKMVKTLESQARYEGIKGAFNRLAHAVLGHFEIPRGKTKGNEPGTKEFVAMCVDAMDIGGEGFNKDYLHSMPIGDKTAINFNEFERDGSARFDFDELINIYTKGVADSALVDMEIEIERDIFIPLMIEMGINIASNASYDPNNQEYLTESDFEQAKKMGEGLRNLKKSRLIKLRETKEEVETKEEDSTEISEEKRKGNEALLKGLTERMERVMAEKEAKKEKTAASSETKKKFG